MLSCICCWAPAHSYQSSALYTQFYIQTCGTSCKWNIPSGTAVRGEDGVAGEERLAGEWKCYSNGGCAWHYWRCAYIGCPLLPKSGLAIIFLDSLIEELGCNINVASLAIMIYSEPEVTMHGYLTWVSNHGKPVPEMKLFFTTNSWLIQSPDTAVPEGSFLLMWRNYVSVTLPLSVSDYFILWCHAVCYLQSTDDIYCVGYLTMHLNNILFCPFMWQNLQ